MPGPRKPLPKPVPSSLPDKPLLPKLPERKPPERRLLPKLRPSESLRPKLPKLRPLESLRERPLKLRLPDLRVRRPPERRLPDSLSSDADSSECRDSMLKLRTTTPADATLVEALTATVKSVEREEETEVATKSSRPPRRMFCTETTYTVRTFLSARAIATLAKTATRASSAPREVDTPKSLAAPERERRTGITVSPSPSLPKRSSRRMFCTETTS